MFLNGFRTMLPGILRRSLSSSTGPAMEKSLNRVTLLGRVGVDPQLRGNDRSPVALFTLATNSNYIFESGEIQQRTEWHRISVFKPHLRDSVMKLLKKGSRVLVEGRLAYGEIVDSKGNSVTSTSIIAGEIVFLSTRAANSEEENRVLEEKLEESEAL